MSLRLSDQSRRIAIKPSIRLLTECLGMRSEIKGIEAAEATSSSRPPVQDQKVLS
jgi:hypothetical protein